MRWRHASHPPPIRWRKTRGRRITACSTEARTERCALKDIKNLQKGAASQFWNTLRGSRRHCRAHFLFPIQGASWLGGHSGKGVTPWSNDDFEHSKSVDSSDRKLQLGLRDKDYIRNVSYNFLWSSFLFFHSLLNWIFAQSYSFYTLIVQNIYLVMFLDPLLVYSVSLIQD